MQHKSPLAQPEGKSIKRLEIQYNESLMEFGPVQRLTASVTISLVLPFQCHMASRTTGIRLPVSVNADFIDRYRLSVCNSSIRSQ